MVVLIGLIFFQKNKNAPWIFQEAFEITFCECRFLIIS